MLLSWIGVILLVVECIAEVESVIFPSSLIGATMQDGGKRERRDDAFSLITTPKNLISLIFYLYFSSFTYNLFSANVFTTFPTTLSCSFFLLHFYYHIIYKTCYFSCVDLIL